MYQYKNPMKSAHVYPGTKPTTYTVELSMKDGRTETLEVKVDEIGKMVDSLYKDGITAQFTQKSR